jgi:hypothetical protein
MIRTIHPFYLLGLMSVLLVILIWQNSKIQNNISSMQSERSSARSMAKRIVDLKKVMKAVDKRQLDNYLDGPLFAGSALTHKVKNKRYIVDAKEMNARQLQSFLNRILNMSVKVMQLKIQSKDDKHASLYMEISL